MKVKIVDTLRLSVVVSPKQNSVLYKGEPIKVPDIVIPRIGASITSFGGCVMFQLEKMGVPLLNSSDGMYNSRDKFRCSQILSAHGLPIPTTMMLRRPTKKDLGNIDPMERKLLIKQRVQKAIELLSGPPAIIKLPKGTQGVGVILCNSMNEIYAQVDMLWKQKQEFIIQEFIKESSGVDVRAMVVGDRVVASMKRESKTGDFRSNTHQGGVVSAYTLPKEAEKIAIQAAHAVGLQVAGVDMLIKKDGFSIIEVNSSPGFEGLEKATDVNVAEAIMEHARHMSKVMVKTKKLRKKAATEIEILSKKIMKDSFSDDILVELPPWEGPDTIKSGLNTEIQNA